MGGDSVARLTYSGDLATWCCTFAAFWCFTFAAARPCCSLELHDDSPSLYFAVTYQKYHQQGPTHTDSDTHFRSSTKRIPSATRTPKRPL